MGFHGAGSFDSKTSKIINAGNNKILLLIGIILLIIVSHVRLIEEIRADEVLRKQDVYSYEERFKELREYLTAVKKVGYITDCQRDDNDRKTRLYITQYAVAPVIVVDTCEMEYVVGNFCQNNISTNIWSEKKLILIKNFGKGVMLFRKASRQ